MCENFHLFVNNTLYEKSLISSDQKYDDDYDAI